MSVDWEEESLHVSAMVATMIIADSKLMTTGFCNENALILYVYLANDNDESESVLTVSRVLSI